MLTNRTILFGLLALCVAGSTGCRPRASRTAAARNRAAAPAASIIAPGTPSAKSILGHADSALARIATMNQDVPPETQPMAQQMDYPSAPAYYPPPPLRSPTGAYLAPQPSISDYGLYEAALGEYNNRRYDDAINLFSQVIAAGRPPELIPNSYFWIGESDYAMGRYAESMPYFEYVTHVGPSYKRQESMYKLSRGNLNLGNHGAANMWYERLRNEYPTSSYARTLAKLGTR